MRAVLQRGLHGKPPLPAVHSLPARPALAAGSDWLSCSHALWLISHLKRSSIMTYDSRSTVPLQAVLVSTKAMRRKKTRCRNVRKWLTLNPNVIWVKMYIQDNKRSIHRVSFSNPQMNLPLSGCSLYTFRFCFHTLSLPLMMTSPLISLCPLWHQPIITHYAPHIRERHLTLWHHSSQKWDVCLHGN